MELPVQLVERTGRCFVAERRLHRLAADFALQAAIARQLFPPCSGRLIHRGLFLSGVGPLANPEGFN